MVDEEKQTYSTAKGQLNQTSNSKAENDERGNNPNNESE